MALIDEILLRDIAHKGDLQAAAHGDLQRISGLNNLKDALLRRLKTQKGTLVHRPDYGVSIKDFQNAPNTLANHQRMATRIKEQFEQDPRVASVVGVKIIVDKLRPEVITIFVRVIITGLKEIALDFKPFGEII